MAALVATERHLWLNLSELQDKDRFFLLDAPLSPSGLFGGAVDTVVERFQEAKKQAAAFQRFLPRCSQVFGTAEREQSQLSSSSYRQTQEPVPPRRKIRGRRGALGRGSSKQKADLRTVIMSKRTSAKRAPWGQPNLGRRGTHLSILCRSSSVPSGSFTDTPATSGLPRANSPVAARRRYGTGKLTSSDEGARAVRSVVPCQSSASGHRSGSSSDTRGKSRETGSLSRLSDSVETSAKCLTMGPAHCRERLQNSVRFSATSLQRGYSYTSGPQAGYGIGKRSRNSLEEGGHITCSSSQERIRVLQPLPHCSKEGWGVASDHKSASIEPRYQTILVQDAYYQTDRVSNQVWGLVCHDRSQGRILPCIHPSSTQEVPEVCFQGQSIPVSGSSIRPVTLTQHFHEVCRCCLGSVATPGHPHTQFHRRLVDISSVRADGGSASRCRPRPYERAGVMAERQEKCAFSTTENHLSGRDVGFDNDACTVVSCSYRSDSHSCKGSERRPVTHCQTVSETVGSDGSTVHRDIFWPAVQHIHQVLNRWCLQPSPPLRSNKDD